MTETSKLIAGSTAFNFVYPTADIQPNKLGLVFNTKHGSVLVWESGVTETMDNAFTCDSPGFSDEENLSNAKQQAIQWLTAGAKEEAKT